MQNQFFRVGEEVINFAYVTRVTRQGKGDSFLFAVHLIGRDRPIHIEANTAEGRALSRWFDETVPALTDDTEHVPFAITVSR